MLPLCFTEDSVMGPADPLSRFIRKLELHASLSDEDRHAIQALPVTIKALQAHSYLVREGERPEVCAILLSGLAYRQKLASNGERQIVALLVPGDPIDLQNLYLNVSDHNVQMLAGGELAVVPRALVQQLALEQPGIGHAISVANLVEASIYREWLLNIGRRNARSRVAHLLCEFALRLEAQEVADEYGYELPMTQEQLGDALGLTSVHINRTLKVLDAEGLIVRKKPRIRIPDWTRLIGVADFNPSYLHLQQQAPSANLRQIAGASAQVQ